MPLQEGLVVAHFLCCSDGVEALTHCLRRFAQVFVSHGRHRRLALISPPTVSHNMVTLPGPRFLECREVSGALLSGRQSTSATGLPVSGIMVFQRRAATLLGLGSRLLPSYARPPASGIGLTPAGRFMVTGTLAEGRVVLSFGCASGNGLLLDSVDVGVGSRFSGPGVARYPVAVPLAVPEEARALADPAFPNPLQRSRRAGPAAGAPPVHVPAVRSPL